MEKIYSAFVSSTYTSLREERNEVIETLLDNKTLPICMEHFVVSSRGAFDDLKRYIDESDYFIMLLGDVYGSCDENGISWTEREYNYAVEAKKPIFVIECRKFAELLKMKEAELTNDQIKQLEFHKKISFIAPVNEEHSIKDLLHKFLRENLPQCIGWTRKKTINLQEWREKNLAYDLSGLWHHVHLSDDDYNYVRVGTMKIEQDFSPDNYKSFHIEGDNYSIVFYNSAENRIVEDKMKKSHFFGEYTLEDNGIIFGIFNVKREFRSDFNSFQVEKGTRRGIHDFFIELSSLDQATTTFNGEFHDEAPSPKQGRIFVFRDINERNEFLLTYRDGAFNVR